MTQDAKIPLHLTLPQLAAAWGAVLCVKHKLPDVFKADEANLKEIEALFAETFIHHNKEAF